MVPPLRLVGAYDLDARRRITLGRAGLAEDRRYFVLDNPDGVIVLIPAKTVPAREPLELGPETMALLQQAIEQAKAGDVHEVGDFARRRRRD